MNARRKISLWFVLLVFVLLSFSLVQAQEGTETEEAQRDTLIRLGSEWMLGGDNAILEMYVADDYVVHSPFGDLNRDAVRDLFDSVRAALTDMEVSRENLIVEGDTASLRSIIDGTFTHDFNSAFGVFPPTGQPFHWETINVFRFNEAGQIQEEWVQSDTAALMAALGAMPAPAPAASGVLSEEAAAHFVEVFDSFFVGPNPDVLNEIFAPEFVSHLPLAPDLDLEAFKGYVTSFYGGVSDMTQVTNQVIIGEDRLVIHVTYYGTHDGELFGVPATGNAITMNGIGIFRFNEEGLAVENWAVLDMAGVLAQIGALPS
jgi:predicted ester cyclase